ncbi:hypothetical protein NX059_008561 [Plenodomus lindquistii]|nr:hypothetical protein NX059_008561 [Plenodomus lindquistii]
MSSSLRSNSTHQQQGQSMRPQEGSCSAQVPVGIGHPPRSIDARRRPVIGSDRTQSPRPASRIRSPLRGSTRSAHIHQMVNHLEETPDADVHAYPSSPCRPSELPGYRTATHPLGGMPFLPRSCQEVYQQGAGQLIVEYRQHSSIGRNVRSSSSTSHSRTNGPSRNTSFLPHHRRPVLESTSSEAPIRKLPAIILQSRPLKLTGDDVVLFPDDVATTQRHQACASHRQPEIEAEDSRISGSKLNAIEGHRSLNVVQRSGPPAAPRPARLPTPELSDLENIGFCECRVCHTGEEMCKQYGLEVSLFPR